MQRYFVTFSYDGTAYHGWQIQPNGNSVQEELQRALGLLLGRRKEGWPVVGAGRTDAGVHARLMVAHFDCDKALDGQQLAYRLNRLLPRDISVDRIYPVSNEMHARFSAVSRTYHYYLYQHKNPFLRHYAWEVHYDLDFPLMQKAASSLLGEKDFACFCKSGADSATTVCRVSEARFVHQDDGQWMFVITANRFLRNMVRAVVGTLVGVGRHRLSLDGFQQVLQSGSRSDAGESVPGNALFLWDVKY